MRSASVKKPVTAIVRNITRIPRPRGGLDRMRYGVRLAPGDRGGGGSILFLRFPLRRRGRPRTRSPDTRPPWSNLRLSGSCGQLEHDGAMKATGSRSRMARVHEAGVRVAHTSAADSGAESSCAGGSCPCWCDVRRARPFFRILDPLADHTLNEEHAAAVT